MEIFLMYAKYIINMQNCPLNAMKFTQINQKKKRVYNR